MTTIVEVARQAGVSTTTVSHVVNGTRFVSAPARARVEAAIESLGYRPNALARSLRCGRTHTLGLALPDSANPFFAEIGRAVESAAFEAGFSVILCNTENDADRERLYLTLLARKQVDGIILATADARSDSLHALLRGRVPVVAMDREPAGVGLDVVLADHRQGGQLAARHLIRLGHRRIGCITGPTRILPSAERVAGYRSALEEADLAPEDPLMVSGNFHPASGAAAAREMLTGPRAPTAIFACNDLMAVGVLSAAAELGLRVPEDLAVVGYDDIELATYTSPPLTTVAQPKRELGREIVRALLRRIRDPKLPPQREILPVSLKVRGSCGARASDEEAEGEAAQTLRAANAARRRKP